MPTYRLKILTGEIDTSIQARDTHEALSKLFRAMQVAGKDQATLCDEYGNLLATVTINWHLRLAT